MKGISLATIVIIAFIFQLNAQTSNIEWTKFFGGTQYDEANDIRVTSDGGFYFVEVKGSSLSAIIPVVKE